MAHLGLFEYFQSFSNGNISETVSLSDLFETFTDLDHASGSKSVKFQVNQTNRLQVIAVRSWLKIMDHIGQYRAAGQPKSQRQMNVAS